MRFWNKALAGLGGTFPGQGLRRTKTLEGEAQCVFAGQREKTNHTVCSLNTRLGAVAVTVGVYKSQDRRVSSLSSSLITAKDRPQRHEQLLAHPLYACGPAAVSQYHIDCRQLLTSTQSSQHLLPASRQAALLPCCNVRPSVRLFS